MNKNIRLSPVISLFAIAVILTGQPAEASDVEPIWDSAKILIGHGNTSADPEPSLVIECPLFSKNGRFAKAFHTLDLSDLQTTGRVRGLITVGNKTVNPDFSKSIAAEVTRGSDGNDYRWRGNGDGWKRIFQERRYGHHPVQIQS